MVDSARARSFDSAADLARLDARRRPHLEARDHRTGMHRHHVDVDAEVLELELHQARHRLERLGRIGRLALARIIQQIQRRQLTRRWRIEQRHLAFLLDALALGRGRRRRRDGGCDARRGAALLGLQRLLALELGATPGIDLAAGEPAFAHPVRPGPDPGPDAIHHGEPGHAEGNGRAGHPGREQQQRRAQKIEAGGKRRSGRLADHTAGALRQIARDPVQRCQRAARHQHHQKAGAADRDVQP